VLSFFETDCQRVILAEDIDSEEGRYLNIIKKEELKPKCPYCESDLSDIFFKQKGPGLLFSKTAVYFCPHCRKVLGIGRSNIG